jgi:hypothetical protein
MFVDQQGSEKLKVIGCKVTENGLQNLITPIMHDCYNLRLIKHDTVSSFVRFCINFWIGHYHMKKKKKEQFDTVQEEIEEEEEKLVAIAAEKEQLYEKSTARVVEKAIKQTEELGEQLERDFEEDTTHPSSYYQRSRKQQQSVPSRTVASLSLESMMRKNE